MSRIINILLTELTSDRLKQEQEMERIINDNVEISKKVDLIKQQLKEIVLTDLMISEWRNLTNESDTSEL
jgi:hypothetical protein